ncbi:PREDICTED: NADPH-dependent diflavin oxidoreductase ATR3-like [Fragaria vesca subsp. vesca]
MLSLRCNLDPESFITVHNSEVETQLLDTHVPIKLRTFVELTMDVASVSLWRYFFVARFNM